MGASMTKNVAVLVLILLGLTTTCYAQYVPIEWTPVNRISAHFNSVVRLAVTSDGRTYVAVRNYQDQTNDTFAVYTRGQAETDFSKIDSASGPAIYDGGVPQFTTWDRAAYYISRLGLTKYSDGMVQSRNQRCLPQAGFDFVTAYGFDSLLIGSSRVIDTVGQDTYARVVYRYEQGTCTEVSEIATSFVKGVPVGVGYRPGGQELIGYAGGRQVHDTIFYRFSGVGVYSDLRRIDPVFRLEYIQGYRDGWIVTGIDRRLQHCFALLDADLRVIRMDTVPRFPYANPGNLIRIRDSENAVLHISSRSLFIVDKGTFAMTRVAFEADELGLNGTFGNTIVDATLWNGDLFIATDHGIRRYSQSTSTVRDQTFQEAMQVPIYVSSTDTYVRLPFTAPARVLVCDLIGQCLSQDVHSSVDGAHIAVNVLHRGLNVVSTGTQSIGILVGP